MKIENPAALRFIMQDEIYLLEKDKAFYSTPARQEPPPVIVPEPVSFRYSGGHKKRFLIMVHYPDTEFIDQKHLTALESILKRLDYTLNDAAIFNRAAYADSTYEALMEFFKPQKMLFLGESSRPPGIEHIAHNKPVKLNDCHTLYTFSFGEMMDNNEYKKAFWEQMKQL